MDINLISILIFIGILFGLVYKHRKNFEFQKIGNVPFAALLKTKFGMKFINKVGTKHSKFLKVLGYIGLVVGFIGIITMFGMIATFFVKLLINPAGPTAVSMVIPGVKVPGSPIYIPFWYGIIALFIVVVVHEFGHGIIAKAHDLKILSTGLALITILPAAFVEPDDKALDKKKDKVQYSVFAAGPWFNVILAIIFFVLFIIAALGLTSLVNNDGFMFESIQSGSPAELAGLPTNTSFNKINNISVNSVSSLSLELANTKPGDSITLEDINDNVYSVTLTGHPDAEEKGYIGILGLSNVQSFNTNFSKIVYYVLYIIATLFQWIWVLSFGIGTANLLPAMPLDGGRMVLTFLKRKFNKKKAEKIAYNISILTWLMLGILILVPFFRALIGI